MDMKSILTTLDLVGKPKSADIIAEDEIDEEFTLEEFEALEEDDELEEATIDDWHKASGRTLTSRSQEKIPGGTLRKSTYLPQDKIDQAVEIVSNMGGYDANGAYDKILADFGDNLGEMLWNTEEVQAELERVQAVGEGLVKPDKNRDELANIRRSSGLEEERVDEAWPLIAAGVAGLAYGGKKLYDKFKKDKEEKKDPITKRTNRIEDEIEKATESYELDEGYQQVQEVAPALVGALGTAGGIAAFYKLLQYLNNKGIIDVDKHPEFGTQQNHKNPNETQQESKELSDIRKLSGLEEENDVVPYADPELDFEGDMAKNQLARITMHAEHLASMLDDNENMPEWVQSKITKALDYIATAHDYLMGEKRKD